MTDPVSTLARAQWLQREDLKALVAALDPEGGHCRYVGGAVRDTLRGEPVNDIDMATTLLPDVVMQRLKARAIKVVPTGIDHGTVTVVLPDGHVEITTLRRDVSTDGRRATIAYTTEWHEDAARRDFTINALYIDPHSHEIFDYFGGQKDLAEKRVRFIGDADARIHEDYLRIMRFFRFQARFGARAPDAEAFAACSRHAAGLKTLSRERIASELLALLSLGDPLQSVRLMFDAKIWPVILPETGAAKLDDLARLLSRERRFSLSSGPLARLASLLPQDTQTAQRMAARLRFSNAMRKQLMVLLQPDRCDASHARKLVYELGAKTAVKKLLLFADDGEIGAALENIRGWQPPRFVLSGKDVIAAGVPPGPDVSRALKIIEQRWIGENFPDDRRQQKICLEVSKTYID